MLKYTTKRLLYSAVILIFVMFIIYTLMYSMPTTYLEQKARELASKPGAGKSYDQWLEDLNAQYGMDKGLIAGYFTWVGTALRGEWGESWAWTVPVVEQFNNTVWYSFALGLVTLILQIIIAIPPRHLRRQEAVRLHGLLHISGVDDMYLHAHVLPGHAAQVHLLRAAGLAGPLRHAEPRLHVPLRLR